MKVIVQLNNGVTKTVDVIDYDAQALKAEVNDVQIQFVTIGNMLVNKHILTLVDTEGVEIVE